MSKSNEYVESAEGVTTSLRPIFMYLNIIDAVNLAATCTSLRKFAISEYFAKKAKHIKIEKNNNGIIILTVPFDNGFTTEIQSMEKLEFLFSYIGESVEELTFKSVCFERLNPTQKSKVVRIFVIVMEHCKYMKTLCFKDCATTVDETLQMLHGNGMSKNLKEVNVSGFNDENLNTLPVTLKGTLKVDILTLSVENNVISHFFEYFGDLVSLNVEFWCQMWRDEHEKIFDLISDDLEILKVMDSHSLHRISKLICNYKLLKLKEFSFMGRNNASISRPSRPHPLTVYKSKINSILNIFSYDGIIERLIFENAVFDDKSYMYGIQTDQCSYRFNRLKHFRLFSFTEPNCAILKALTRSHMPVICSFDIDLMFYSTSAIQPELTELLKFFESKKTLSTIRLACGQNNLRIPLPFYKCLIAILNEPCTPVRPFLNLKLGSGFIIGGCEVSKMIPCDFR